MEDIDKEQFDPAGHLDETGNQSVEQQHDEHKREQQGNDGALQVGILELAVVINQHDGRDTQQVEQVHRNRHADDVGDEYDVAVGVRLVGYALPFENQPEYECRTERGVGINLALYGREPEGIGPGIGQSTYHAATQNGNHLTHRHGLDGLALTQHNLLCQTGDGPEQQQDGGGTQQSRHEVDHVGYPRGRRGKVGKEAGRQHEDGVSRRVTHFQFISRSYKFTAVPKTGGRLQSQDIGNRRNDEDHPSQHIVQ